MRNIHIFLRMNHRLYAATAIQYTERLAEPVKQAIGQKKKRKHKIISDPKSIQMLLGRSLKVKKLA